MPTWTLDSLFDALGGPTAIASERGLAVSTVSSWKSRGSVPVEHWAPLIAMANRRGKPELTAEVLLQIHDRSSAPSVGAERQQEVVA
jgi:hypothetical protein